MKIVFVSINIISGVCRELYLLLLLTTTFIWRLINNIIFINTIKLVLSSYHVEMNLNAFNCLKRKIYIVQIMNVYGCNGRNLSSFTEFLDLHINCSYRLTIRYSNESCCSRSLMSSLQYGAETKCLLYSMYIVSNVCYDMLGAFLRNNNMDYKRSGHNSSWSKTAQVVKRKLEGSFIQNTSKQLGFT